MFVKITERCPQGKRITISSKIWQELQKHISKVQQAKSEGKGLRVQLLGDKHLILEKFPANGIWYTGVHDVSPAGTIVPLTGLNFDEVEWEVLMGHMPAINSSLNVTTEVKGKKRSSDGRVLGEVLMYKWKWMLGKKKLSESSAAFFSEADCKRNADRYIPTPGTDYVGEKMPTVLLEKVWASPPDKFLHMRQIYVYLLARFLREVAQSYCDGCKVAASSQIDHMGLGGCLAEDVNQKAEYIVMAKSKITASLMLTMFEASRRQIGATPIFVQLIAEAVLAYLSDDRCIEIMKDPGNVKYVHIDMMLETVGETVLG